MVRIRVANFRTPPCPIVYSPVFWRACNALAEFSVTKDLQPDDRPEWMRDRLRAEPRDVMLTGHFPHLPRLLSLLVSGGEAGAAFPLHGVVALLTDDQGDTWRELWRISPRGPSSALPTTG